MDALSTVKIIWHPMSKLSFDGFKNHWNKSYGTDNIPVSLMIIILWDSKLMKNVTIREVA
jgi:hypothetical protein